MSIEQVKIMIKDKDFELDSIKDLKSLHKNVISILEIEYNKKIKESNNLYKLYYIDEDNDKIYIKTPEDFTYFSNTTNVIHTEIDEEAISKLKGQEENKESETISITENELNMIKKIEKLKRKNEQLEKEKGLIKEINQIYLQKINVLEEEQKIKKEKEQSILEELENKTKEKNEIKEQLEEAKKLNESMSMVNANNNLGIFDNDNNANDILISNLKEEKEMLKNQLEMERNKVGCIEKVYSEDNERLKNEMVKLRKENDKEKKEILEKNDFLIKSEIEKGINEYINQSKINLEKKDNEISKIKNDYENKINTIREECYKEIEQKFSKIYEEKIKQIYESAMNNSKTIYDNLISENKKQFEEEEKKRNQILNSNILMKSNMSNNISRLSKCETIHKNIACNECKVFPIVGYRYRCLECPDYNLCEKCEKTVEHEHNFIKYVSEENNSLIIKNNKYSYECLTKKLVVSVYEGAEKATLRIVIKNNGFIPWTENAKFINGKDSQIIATHITLKPLEPGEQDTIEINFDGLKTLPARNYISNFLFSVDEQIYGNPLKTELIVEKIN